MADRLFVAHDHDTVHGDQPAVVTSAVPSVSELEHTRKDLTLGEDDRTAPDLGPGRRQSTFHRTSPRGCDARLQRRWGWRCRRRRHRCRSHRLRRPAQGRARRLRCRNRPCRGWSPGCPSTRPGTRRPAICPRSRASWDGARGLRGFRALPCSSSVRMPACAPVKPHRRPAQPLHRHGDKRAADEFADGEQHVHLPDAADAARPPGQPRKIVGRVAAGGNDRAYASTVVEGLDDAAHVVDAPDPATDVPPYLSTILTSLRASTCRRRTSAASAAGTYSSELLDGEVEIGEIRAWRISCT